MSRLMIVGQNPGGGRWQLCDAVEPWLQHAGFRPGAAHRAFFTNAYLGDRPSPDDAQRISDEVARCSPCLVLAVGRAAARVLIFGSLPFTMGRTVGDVYNYLDTEVLILPHPSGRNRWLNDQANLERLDLAFITLHRLRMTTGLYKEDEADDGQAPTENGGGDPQEPEQVG